jgi:glycosyltransferase involved in cell wall biosynthesis
MEYCATNGVRYCAIVQANGEAFWPAAVNLDRLRSAYRQAQAIYFVSEANRKLLEQQLALALPQAQVVRNPFNVPYDVQMPYPTPDREWRLACVARMDPCAKGQDLLFQVLALPHWRARPLTVSLYGAGAHEPTLRDLVQMHGLNDSVRFCGHNSDVVQVWREHQALILPSRIEGLPLVLVEAMLCGRVSIVTDVGGNAEIVEEGKTGFIAEGPTVALLNAALERAWAVRDHWQTFGAEAAKAVRSFVPADPAGVFAEKLLSLASSPN